MNVEPKLFVLQIVWDKISTMNTETKETVGTIVMLFVGTITETSRIPKAGPKH